MPLQPIVLNLPAKSPILQYGDTEFEIGAIASRHGVSLDQARFLVEQYGNDLDCIDDRVTMWKKIATG